MFRMSAPSIFVACCIAILSVVLYKLRLQESESTVQGLGEVPSIITYWNRSISPPEKQFKNLVIGINSNVDIIVPGVALLKALNVLAGKKRNHELLSDLDQLQETFSHFLARGSAAERPFLNEELYKKIIKEAESLDQAEYFVGGNAALIAKKAGQLFPNLKINFIGPVGPILKKLIPTTIVVDSACQTKQDEVHLIMEYQIGEVWGDAVAPVANRFVTSFDETNSQMLMLEPLFASVKSSRMDLIVLSGLHMMDAQPPEIFNQRLDKLISLLYDVPQSTVSHLELASMTNKVYVKQIVEKVLPNINSLGLNEQELVFASKSCGGPHADLFDLDSHGQPDIHKISDILLWMMTRYGHSENGNPSSRLTRIHFHSLTYHIMAVLESHWLNTESAVSAGARAAGLQACDTAELREDLVGLKIPSSFKLFTGDSERELDAKIPATSWRRGGFLFVLSPVLVCKQPVKTVGLGDAISATGLMFSQFHSLS